MKMRKNILLIMVKRKRNIMNKIENKKRIWRISLYESFWKTKRKEKRTWKKLL